LGDWRCTLSDFETLLFGLAQLRSQGREEKNTDPICSNRDVFNFVHPETLKIRQLSFWLVVWNIFIHF
jgi:hypothetical protein